MLLPPFATEAIVELLSKPQRQLDWFPSFVDGDGLAKIIDDHLASLAAGEMLLKLAAQFGIDRSIDVFAQTLQQLLTLHTFPNN